MSTAAITATVFYKTAWAGPWTAADADLVCDGLRFATAPGFGTARLSRDYGLITRPGSPAAVVTALDLRGKYLKVEITDTLGTTPATWYGYIVAQDDQIDGSFTSPIDGTTTVHSGRSTYIAHTLDYILRQTAYSRCYILDAPTRTTVQQLARPLAFNATTRRRNHQLTGRRSATKPAGYSCYVHDPISTTPWTALDALEHLLYALGQQTGFGFTLATSGSQHAYLANITEPWPDGDGRSYFDMLNTLIDPARGFTWYLDGGTLYVVSISDVAIGSYIPANPNVTALNLNTATGLQGSITHLEQVHYDKILVQGEPLRVCFTMNTVWGSLEPAWDATAESAYAAATDPERQKELHAPVYCRFRLPNTWNGKVNTKEVLPAINTATGAVDWTTQQKYFLPDLLLDRSLPITETGGKEPRPPLILCAQDGEYFRVNAPKLSGLTGTAVRMLDDAPGFQLDPRYPHYYGLGRFTAASDDACELDYGYLCATVSLYTHERVRILVNALEAEPGELERIKTIDIPNCHLWVVAEGTVTDFTTAGVIQEPANRILRDDTAILTRVADLARVWYGRRRSAVTVRWQVPYVLNRLGHIITETYTGGSAVPTGTVITAIEYDFRSLTATLSTEWYDIDIQAVTGSGSGSGRSPGRAATGAGDTARIIDLQEQLCNTPVRTAGSSPAPATLHPWKIWRRLSGTDWQYAICEQDPSVSTALAGRIILPDGTTQDVAKCDWTTFTATTQLYLKLSINEGTCTPTFETSAPTVAAKADPAILAFRLGSILVTAGVPDQPIQSLNADVSLCTAIVPAWYASYATGSKQVLEHLANAAPSWAGTCP
jgi:hypothetical protein